MRLFIALSLILTFNISTKAQLRQLYFVQNGDTILPSADGWISLKRSTFEIQSTLHDNDVVMSNLSTDSNNVHAIEAGTPKDSLYCFRGGTGMSDYRDNTEKSLLIKNTDNSYWAYVSARNYKRFDKDSVVGENIYVTRTVEKLISFEEDARGEWYIKDAPMSQLFIVYFVNYDAEDGSRNRTKPQTLKIQFID